MQCLQRSGTYACRLSHFTAGRRNGHADLGALHLQTTPIQGSTVDGSEKLVSLPIHTSPGTSIVSQTSILGNIPNGTDHFMARLPHLMNADDTLDDDDMTGEAHKRSTTGVRKRSPAIEAAAHDEMSSFLKAHNCNVRILWRLLEVTQPQFPYFNNCNVYTDVGKNSRGTCIVTRNGYQFANVRTHPSGRIIWGTLLKPPTPPGTKPVELALCVNVYAASDYCGGLYPTNTALQELVTAIQVEDVVDILNIQRPHYTFNAHSSIMMSFPLPLPTILSCCVQSTVLQELRCVGEIIGCYRRDLWVKRKWTLTSVLYFYERALRDLGTTASTGTNVKDTARRLTEKILHIHRNNMEQRMQFFHTYTTLHQERISIQALASKQKMCAKRHVDAIRTVAGITLRDPVSIAAAFLDHYSRLYWEQTIDNDAGAPFALRTV
ncbi:hypothetical protein PR048_015849 [Dryococelus australis]|uniref:Uncharacterized protein n=1 Tax=Dryococelus australis TaxID=614101 RepID=A0ABQ9HI37_9NEOP|nr:hypothetical protein PR048_015849 [Dryococelus australis]